MWWIRKLKQWHVSLRQTTGMWRVDCDMTRRSLWWHSELFWEEKHAYFLYMNVPLCVWGCVCMYMYVPVHMKVRGQLRCHLYCSPPNFMRQVFSLNWSLLTQLAWLVSEPQGSFWSSSHGLGIQEHTAMCGLDAGDPNSGSRALPTGTSPGPPLCFTYYFGPVPPAARRKSMENSKMHLRRHWLFL